MPASIPWTGLSTSWAKSSSARAPKPWRNSTRRCASLALAALAALLVGSARADQPAASTAAAPPVAVSPPEASSALRAETGAIKVFNRVIAEFRAPFLGYAAEERGRRASATLRDLLVEAGPGEVLVEKIPQGRAVKIDGKLAFILTPEDANVLAGESLDASTERAVRALRRAVEETREARNLDAILGALLKVGIATATLAVALWLLRRIRGWIAAGIARLGSRHAERLRVGGHVLVGREQIFAWARGLTTTLFWLLVALLVYEWLGYGFSQFPYTRPWGEGLQEATIKFLLSLATGLLQALPNLAVAAVIFLIAALISRATRRALQPFIKGETQPSGWLDRDTARPTRNLLVAGIWVFAIAMAYPYLPGSQSEAFKGLSVLLGLMISLGSTSIVGQGANGLILMFTRTIRTGEYVRIGEFEGTVMDLGAFTTRIRTGMGEELTISNSLIAGAVTKNYSRAVSGNGFVVDATVTIGYDTPWRQVQAMLVEAARRTDGILATPTPVVFQTALSDFYPEYRIVAQAVPADPRPRAMVMSDLHANIQDVFNEYGVQIMSPHYLGDPAEAKIVPPAKWHPAPAPQPMEGKSRG